MKEEARKILDEQYIHHLIPLLWDFTFVGMTPYFDVYLIFIVEPMNLFHLGVSRMIKEAAMERLRCTMKTTDHYKNIQRSVRTFESLQLPIIRQINKFVKEISTQADGAPLGLCVRNSEEWPGLNGAFTDHGLAGMLEAADIK